MTVLSPREPFDSIIPKTKESAVEAVSLAAPRQLTRVTPWRPLSSARLATRSWPLAEAGAADDAGASHRAAIEGAYYSDQLARMEMDGRLTALPIDLGIPVLTSWDLGLNDATSIWFVQVIGREIRFGSLRS